jgi:3-deoxy-manno-octulosonate cytidylyltransferase (CMP-KDO synthetase)
MKSDFIVDFIVIIPARLKSSRLDEKLLKEINGKPLLYWTYQNALKSKATKVIIATDSNKIKEVMAGFGANCVLTSENCESGTARIAEVVKAENFNSNQIIINVQGDEPLLPFEVINQLADNLLKTDSKIATLCENFTSVDDYQNPNNVKVVFDKDGSALYFSRSPIPFFRDDKIDLNLCFKHIGIYGYKADFFDLELKLNSYETAEKLEQLSILQNGHKIHIEKSVKDCGIGVDTQKDLEKVRNMFNDN